MTPEDMLSHNEMVAKAIEEREREIAELRSTIKAPCETCKYDSVFRCEACMNDYYRGYNVKDYCLQFL